MTIDAAYKAPILSGKKTTTIRYGRYDAAPGSEVYLVLRPSDTAVAKLRIVDVRRKKVGELTEEDARKDGFSGLMSMLRALNRIYGELYADDEVTVIEFEVVKVLRDAVPLKWLKELRYHEPLEIARTYLENTAGLAVSDENDFVMRRIYGEGLGRAVRTFGPKRVRGSLVRVYRALRDAGVL